MDRDNDALIATYIEQDPGHPGLADARLKDYGTHVWALIGYLYAVGWDVERAARDYGLPLEAVRAVLAYHQQHQDLIEARIDANAAPAA